MLTVIVILLFLLLKSNKLKKVKLKSFQHQFEMLKCFNDEELHFCKDAYRVKSRLDTGYSGIERSIHGGVVLVSPACSIHPKFCKQWMVAPTDVGGSFGVVFESVWVTN